jgi:hypothetical protein
LKEVDDYLFEIEKAQEELKDIDDFEFSPENKLVGKVDEQ